jgi:signal transduction histidine kinase
MLVGAFVISETLKGAKIQIPELQESLTELQRLAGIGTLTAGVAHEMTNPINVITATCNNLLSQLADGSLSDDELLHYVEMIDQSAWRCARLLRTLRDYSYLETQIYSLCKVNQIVESALTLVGYEFERQHNINLVTNFQAEMDAIECDQNQITQVLINLLVNAKDAIPANGGTIRISTWALPEQNVQAISISDSGSGIEPVVQDRLFEPFVTTKPLGQGTGLGLAISSKILADHGGSIRAENGPDGGAIFTVLLPVSRR